MIKVLVANENKKENTLCSRFLSNYKNFEVNSVDSGINTLTAYFNIEPDVFILDSYFTDIKYTEILDKLSMIPNNNRISNTIVTVNNKKEQLYLKNTSRVYRILQKPFKLDNLLNTIHLLINEMKYEELTKSEIDSLLLQLNFHLGSNGTKYIRTAIFQCYYYPSIFNSLDDIFRLIAYI